MSEKNRKAKVWQKLTPKNPTVGIPFVNWKSYLMLILQHQLDDLLHVHSWSAVKAKIEDFKIICGKFPVSCYLLENTKDTKICFQCLLMLMFHYFCKINEKLLVAFNVLIISMNILTALKSVFFFFICCVF